MGFRVRQRQCRTPRAAKHLPAFDAQVGAQALDVGDQIPGRVLAQLRMRRGASTAALVEQHDPVHGWVEEPPALRAAARAGTAVQEHDRFPVQIAALLVIQRVQPRNLQRAAVERWLWRVANARAA